MSEPDLYSTLGLSSSATPDKIKHAYRNLAKQYHPDKNNTEEATHKFQQISAAYEILSDPQKREHYDRGGQLKDLNFGGSNFFANIFSTVVVSTRMDKIIELSYQELIEGCTRELTLNDQIYTDRQGNPVSSIACLSCQGGILGMFGLNCPECNNTGRSPPSGSIKSNRTLNLKVQVPPRSWPGRVLILEDKKIQLKPISTPELHHSGIDLIYIQKMDVFSALLGKDQIIRVVGKNYKIEHTRPVTPGLTATIEGQGLYDSSGHRGNIVVVFEVEFPKSLNDVQRIHLRKCIQ